MLNGARIEFELSAQAKGRLMARQAALVLPVDADRHDALAEREYLQGAIGATGRVRSNHFRSQLIGTIGAASAAQA